MSIKCAVNNNYDVDMISHTRHCGISDDFHAYKQPNTMLLELDRVQRRIDEQGKVIFYSIMVKDDGRRKIFDGEFDHFFRRCII
jgi:hypothetical protein